MVHWCDLMANNKLLFWPFNLQSFRFKCCCCCCCWLRRFKCHNVKFQKLDHRNNYNNEFFLTNSKQKYRTFCVYKISNPSTHTIEFSHTLDLFFQLHFVWDYCKVIKSIIMWFDMVLWYGMVWYGIWFQIYLRRTCTNSAHTFTHKRVSLNIQW